MISRLLEREEQGREQSAHTEDILILLIIGWISFFEYDFISSQLLNIIFLYFMYFISGLDFGLKVPPQT